MADPRFLDQFIDEQTDLLSRHLAEVFREIVRDDSRAAADYPSELRHVMDRIFAENLNEISRTGNS